jgi:hypothetical protein
MAHRRKLLLVLLLALLLLGLVLVAGAGWWWWYAQSLPLPFRIVARGSSSSSGNLGVSGGSLVLVAPKPGIYFGTVRKPGGPEQFTYLILFRHARPGSHGSKWGIESHCTSDTRGTAETKDAIELDGKRIEAAYRLELDETLTAVANESLAIGGKNVDMVSGRVFLIDLGAETPTYQQKKVELPAIPSPLESTDDVERLAETIRTSLESQDPEIKAFLR